MRAERAPKEKSSIKKGARERRSRSLASAVVVLFRTAPRRDRLRTAPRPPPHRSTPPPHRTTPRPPPHRTAPRPPPYRSTPPPHRTAPRPRQRHSTACRWSATAGSVRRLSDNDRGAAWRRVGASRSFDSRVLYRQSQKRRREIAGGTATRRDRSPSALLDDPGRGGRVTRAGCLDRGEQQRGEHSQRLVALLGGQDVLVARDARVECA